MLSLQMLKYKMMKFGFISVLYQMPHICQWSSLSVHSYVRGRITILPNPLQMSITPDLTLLFLRLNYFNPVTELFLHYLLLSHVFTLPDGLEQHFGVTLSWDATLLAHQEIPHLHYFLHTWTYLIIFQLDALHCRFLLSGCQNNGLLYSVWWCNQSCGC